MKARNELYTITRIMLVENYFSRPSPLHRIAVVYKRNPEYMPHHSMDDLLESVTVSVSGVPAVLQEAMKTLAHTSTSLMARLRALEREIERERLRSFDTSSQLRSRIEALESRLKKAPLQTPEPNVRESKGQVVDVDERLCAFEKRVRLELEAGRADAAAARAEASWRGTSDDLVRASVSIALGEMAPRLAGDAASVAVRELAKIPRGVNKEQMAHQAKLTQDVAEAKELVVEALATISCLSADITKLPSRIEVLSMATSLCPDYSRLT